MSTVRLGVLSRAEVDWGSAKYRLRSSGLGGSQSVVCQVSIGQSDLTSYGSRSAVNCTIGRPGLDNPGLQWFSNLHCKSGAAQ